MKWPSQCCKPFKNRMISGGDIPKSGAEIQTFWKMNLSTSHAMLVYRRSFGTSHRWGIASQRVAGPIGQAKPCDAAHLR